MTKRTIAILEAAFTMAEALREGGWSVSRVVPMNDVEWVSGPWARRLGQLLRRGAEDPGGL